MLLSLHYLLAWSYCALSVFADSTPILSHIRSMRNEATELMQQKEWKKAQEVLILAQETSRLLNGEDLSQRTLQAQILQDLGDASIQLEEYDAALSVWGTAREIILMSLGKNHPVYTSLTHRLAEGWKINKSCEKAVPFFEETIELMEEGLGRNHLALREVAIHLSQCHMSLQAPEKASTLLLDHVDRPVEAKKDLYKMEMYMALSTSLILLKTGKETEAVAYAELAVSAAIEMEGHVSMEHALALNNLAGILTRKGHKRAALDHLKTALRIARKQLPEEHPMVQSGIQHVSYLHSRLDVKTEL